MRPQYADLEGLRPSFRHRLILFSHSAAYSDSAHNTITPLKRNATCENHDPPVIGGVNAKTLIA